VPIPQEYGTSAVLRNINIINNDCESKAEEWKGLEKKPQTSENLGKL